jgi:Uma2 family endonuclease
MLATDPLYINPDDYLAAELISPIRHEYRAGEVFAMTGGTQNHAMISGNIFAILKSHLRGSGCRTFMENMKVRVATRQAFYYPDVVVSCDPRDRQPHQTFIDYPHLIVEVLSPSTATFDRTEKFADYATIATLETYLLVDTERRHVELRQRDRSTASWTQTLHDANDPIAINHLGFTLPIHDLYEDTDL